MLAISQAIFVVALLVVLPVYVMYFTELHYFGRYLKDQHPDIYAKFSSQGTTGLSTSYLALNAAQKDKAFLASLSPTVQEQFRSTNRYLYIGAISFLIMLLAGLVGAVISKA